MTKERCRAHDRSTCRKHGNRFKTLDDVFNTVEKETTTPRPTSKPKKRKAVTLPGASFQRIDETRHLAPHIPMKILEHRDMNRKELEYLTHEQRLALSGITGFGSSICNPVLLGHIYNYAPQAPDWKNTSHGPMDFHDRTELLSYMEVLDDTLSVRQNETRVVYRGIPIFADLHDKIGASIGKELDPEDMEGLMEGLQEYYKPGNVIDFPTYLSTSHSAWYAASFTDNTFETKNSYHEPEARGILFEFKTNAGLDITSVGQNHRMNEREVLLPRGTHFKVEGIHLRPEKYDTVSGYDLFNYPDVLEADEYKKLAVVVQLVEVDAEGNEINHTQPHHPSVPLNKIIL